MAGDKTITENYSFSGVHHIFDQHKDAGENHFYFFIFILYCSWVLQYLVYAVMLKCWWMKE